ncbi:MAG: cache domain-containing protein [Fimbriimonadaceae bacterium]|nr:cache domain-containing protein [Fimbriimonadaceae bacterium]
MKRTWCRVALSLIALTLLLPGCGSSGDGLAQVGTAADRELLQATVHSAALGLAALAVTPDSRAVDQHVIRNFVHGVTFLDDRSGYFYVYDRTSDVCIAHWKNRDWEGTDKSDYQDSRGTFVIQELSAIANSPAAAGYLVFYWLNPTTNREERKLGYVELIPGTDLYLGSGIYVP